MASQPQPGPLSSGERVRVIARHRDLRRQGAVAEEQLPLVQKLIYPGTMQPMADS